MKEKYSGKIIIKKGKTQIEIHGETDINKAIDLLNRVEKKNKKSNETNQKNLGDFLIVHFKRYIRGVYGF